MLTLFHDKKCCNCFNFVPCILWDFIVLGLVLSWWRFKLKWRISGFARSSRETNPQKSHVRSTWLEAEESCQAVIFVSVWRVRPSYETVAKHFSWRIFKSEFLPFTYTIYTIIIHKCKWGHLERKTLDRFSIIHTPIF